MADYVHLRIFLPTNRWMFGTETRALSADAAIRFGARAPNMRIGSAFFHYDDTGTALSGAPPVRFVDDHSCVTVFGLGAEGIELVERYCHALRRCLAAHYETNHLRMSIEHGTRDARFSKSPVHYHINRLVIQRPGRQPGVFDRSTKAIGNAAALREHVTKIITLGLDAELNLSGMEPLDLDAFWIRELAWHSARTVPYKKTKIGMSGAVELVGVNWWMPTRLYGPWHVGYLRARGYGLVSAFRRASASGSVVAARVA